MNHMTIDELKDELYEVLEKVNTSKEPIYVGEKDKEPEAVLVSLDEFKNMLEAIRNFSDKELSDVIFDRVEGALKDLNDAEDNND